MGLCLCVRHKLVYAPGIKTAALNPAVFIGLRDSFRVFYSVLRKYGVYKNKVLPSGTLSQTLDLQNFHGTTDRCPVRSNKQQPSVSC